MIHDFVTYAPHNSAANRSGGRMYHKRRFLIRGRLHALPDGGGTDRPPGAHQCRLHPGPRQDPGHEEPWIIAMSETPGYLTTLDYARRWGIEPMFSDFKTRGFGLEDSQIRYPDRLAT